MYWCHPNKVSIGNSFTYSHLAPDDPTYATQGYEYCLYLPSFIPTSSLSIEINSGAQFEYVPVATSKKPIVFYGTSIVNGAAASRPGNNMTNIVSRRLYDTPIINLGFTAVGRMEPEVVRAICSVDAQIYILDCLPNLQNNIADIKNRYVNGVDSIKKYYPNAAIVLTEHPAYSNMDTYTPQESTVLSVNAELKKAYETIQTRGYSHIYYITMEELGMDRVSDFADYIHPNDKGMYVYANKYLDVIGQIRSAMGN
jgi:hypothetical protein